MNEAIDENALVEVDTTGDVTGTKEPNFGGNNYEILGLAPGASRAEIDKAYRRLIRRYNPDSPRYAEDQKQKVRYQAHLIISARDSLLRDRG